MRIYVVRDHIHVRDPNISWRQVPNFVHATCTRPLESSSPVGPLILMARPLPARIAASRGFTACYSSVRVALRKEKTSTIVVLVMRGCRCGCC